VILAGGDGERVRPLVHRWLGQHRPKQYCAFTGTRSMFQHTVDRAFALAPADRVIAIAARSHRADVTEQLEQRPIRALLLQPENRDTAAGVFLPLTYIRAHDPRATVVILPSDHFVYPEERFLDIVKRMASAARRLTSHITLLGMTPDRPEIEYGWIEPEQPLFSSPGTQVRTVRSFLEKPDEVRAADAMAAGALWNTLVMAARLDTLWTLGRRCFPEMMPLFEHVEQTLRVSGEMATLDAVYTRMPIRNFSSGLLARAPEHVAVVEGEGVLWSDWGRAERIVDTLSRLGKQPAFPLDLLTTPVEYAS
jgi:mannose-1-phosphate guanylyltransferase